MKKSHVLPSAAALLIALFVGHATTVTHIEEINLPTQVIAIEEANMDQLGGLTTRLIFSKDKNQADIEMKSAQLMIHYHY